MSALPIPDRDHPPLHNLLVCTNRSPYGVDWWLCPPQCRFRAWGERWFGDPPAPSRSPVPATPTPDPPDRPADGSTDLSGALADTTGDRDEPDRH